MNDGGFLMGVLMSLFPFSGFGKFLMVAGALIFLVGLLIMFADRIPFLGRLPGDIYVQRKNISFYFPIVTCILISVILSIILNISSRK
jgi:hypothetical protein